MAEIALGWLGWSEDQTLDADVNAIVVAYNGKMDMLRFIYGVGKEETDPANLPAFTPGDFGRRRGR